MDMAQPYVGEIRMFAGNFAPVGWMFCEGQLLTISENETLFNLIGTTYGGDGQNTFALPNLSGRVPLHVDPNFVLGINGGTETVTLTTNQLPAHSHALQAANTAGYLPSPAQAVPAMHRDYKVFEAAGTSTAALATTTVTATGGNQPHSNLPPYLCVNFIISLFGIFPSQN